MIILFGKFLHRLGLRLLLLGEKLHLKGAKIILKRMSTDEMIAYLKDYYRMLGYDATIVVPAAVPPANTKPKNPNVLN